MAQSPGWNELRQYGQRILNVGLTNGMIDDPLVYVAWSPGKQYSKNAPVRSENSSPVSNADWTNSIEWILSQQRKKV